MNRQHPTAHRSRRQPAASPVRRSLQAAALALLLAACGTPANPPAATVPPAPTATAASAAAPSPAATPAAATPAATEAAPASASPAAAVPGVTATEIVIGSWGPQDGPAGAYGAINRAMAGYFKQINEAGGIHGRTIRFIAENDSYQPAKTVAAVKKLVEEDGVFALAGGLGTPHNLAVMEYLIANNVPHIAPATGSTLIASPPKPGVFALQTNYATEARLLTSYALDTLGGTSVAVFYQNDAFGQEGFDNVNAELAARGKPAAIGVTYEPSDTNFSAQALKLQTSGADTVVLWAVPKPAGTIIAEMAQLGFEPHLLAASVINDPALFKLAGPAIEGLVLGSWLPDFNDRSNPKIAAYHTFMETQLPDEPVGGFTLAGVAYAQLLEEGLRRAGPDLTREKLVAAFSSMQDYTGSLVPSISYGAADHQGAEAIYFMQAKGEVFVKISEFQELK